MVKSRLQGSEGEQMIDRVRRAWGVPIRMVVTGGAGFALAWAAVPSASASEAAAFEVGKSYGHYIEYLPGNAPVILVAPHGGTLLPEDIPDRTKERCGGARTVVGPDRNTAELVQAMRQSFHDRFGTYPHVIINRLARQKLDANRSAAEAACGNADAEQAYKEWHAFIDIAKKEVLRTSERGWFMDIHGHGHKVQRLELGYLLTGGLLDRSDEAIDGDAGALERTSIRSLAKGGETPLSTLLRGPTSLGTLFADAGFPAVPSASDPGPGGQSYFNGGPNTRRHACGSGSDSPEGRICGLQIEAPFRGVRDTAESRKRFGDAAAKVLEQFFAAHWDVGLAGKAKAAGAHD